MTEHRLKHLCNFYYNQFKDYIIKYEVTKNEKLRIDYKSGEICITCNMRKWKSKRIQSLVEVMFKDSKYMYDYAVYYGTIEREEQTHES